MLHVNIKMMTSHQKWYLLPSYFTNKIDFLFSCEICSWSLRFRQFDVCQVNTAQSNTLVHSIVTNKSAKLGAKIFGHFWDIAIFVLRYWFIPSASPVTSRLTSSLICQLISIIITTLIIHLSFTLSLQAQNLPFQQILPTLDFFCLSDCLHDNGTGPDLSRSSFYFCFTFYFFVCSVWWTKLATRQLFNAR